MSEQCKVSLPTEREIGEIKVGNPKCPDCGTVYHMLEKHDCHKETIARLTAERDEALKKIELWQELNGMPELKARAEAAEKERDAWKDTALACEEQWKVWQDKAEAAEQERDNWIKLFDTEVTDLRKQSAKYQDILQWIAQLPSSELGSGLFVRDRVRKELEWEK